MLSDNKVTDRKLLYVFRIYNTYFKDRQQLHITYFGKLKKNIEIYGAFVSKSSNHVKRFTDEIIPLRY